MKPHRVGLLTAAGLLVLVAVVPLSADRARGQSPRGLEAGSALPDCRLGPPRHLNGRHPFQPVGSAAEWAVRRTAICRRVAVSAGLWPMPERIPLCPVVHGQIDQGDYTVEKVFFESWPGHFVTGNLYRPAGGTTTPRPGVLCPHGHWPGGRFMDAGRETAEREIAQGAERFVNGGRSPLQARCVALARLGCVVFHYDMLGYSDSIQFSTHRPAIAPGRDGREPGTWGFGGFAAASRLQSTFGLQTFNSVRALDFLVSLPDVDSQRIAVTGASGGATQTMMLTALDDRVTAAFPAVMVSTAMQGGCTCENGHLLRIDQGNIDIAAVTAPRPLGLTTADDWTKNLKTQGWPDLRDVYRLAGATDAVESHFDTQFPHNFNAVARGHLLRFLARHFVLDTSRTAERDFEWLSPEQLTVWDDAHPLPAGDSIGVAHELAVCRVWDEEATRTIAPLLAPPNAESLARAHDLLAVAWRVIFRRGVPAAADVGFLPGPGPREKAGAPVPATLAGLVTLRPHEECVPVAVTTPAKWNGTVVVMPHPSGKDGLYNAEGPAAGRPGTLIARLGDRGCAVVAMDLFGQGESTVDGAALQRNQRVYSLQPYAHPADRWRLDPVYTYGYNDALFVRRVHDLLTVIASARRLHGRTDCRVALVGIDGAGHWALAALAAAAAAGDRPAVDVAIVETMGFHFADVPSVWHADFLPGAVKYGDVAGMLVMAAPMPLVLIKPDEAAGHSARSAWAAAGADSALMMRKTADDTEWIDILAESQPSEH